MLDMPMPLPIETAPTEQVRYWEDSRYSEMISALAPQFENPLLNSLTSSQILAVLDTHFPSIYERSLDWFDRIEALADRLANEENPDQELCNELRDFVVSLVRIGSVEKDSFETNLLNLEIEDLLAEEDEAYLSGNRFMYAPNNPYKIEWRFPNWKDNVTVEYIPCRGFFGRVGHGVAKGAKVVGKGVKKGAKKTAHFFQEHKKEIIIGVVVVTAAVVTGGIAAGVAGATQAGIAAAAEEGVRNGVSDKDKPKGTSSQTITQPVHIPSSQPSTLSLPPQTSNLRTELLNQKPQSPSELFKDRRPDFDVGEKIKSAAATMVHEIWHPLGAIKDQARKEGRDIEKVLNVVSDKIFPFSPRNPEIEKDVKEVIEKSESYLVAGHKEVDDFFGIKRERGYEEFVENRQKGIAKLELPLLGGTTLTAGRVANSVGRVLNAEQKAVSLAERMAVEVNGGALEGRVGSAVERTLVKDIARKEIIEPTGKVINDEALLQAGRVIDRGGFTKAGRHSMKHGYREESVFPKPFGNPAQVNEHGQKILEKIIKHPERQITIKEHNLLGTVIDIKAPDLGGARFSGDGDVFIGFLEP